MSSPDLRGPRKPKRHPACPGKRGCTLEGCIHNAPISRIWTNEIFVDLYEVNGMLATYPSVRFAGGLLYQRLSTASDLRANVRGIDDEPKATIGSIICIAQSKIREVSDNILDRICSSTEMLV